MEERILDMLNQLATKLGTTSEFIFEIMTKKAFIVGVFLSTFGALGFIVSNLLIVKFIKHNDEEIRFGVVAACLLVMIVAIAISCEGIVRIYIPEATAFRNILELLQ